MKSLFKKREAPFVYNRYYLFVQEKWVRKMEVLTQGFSNKQLILFLVLFIAFSSAYFLFIVYEALN